MYENKVVSQKLGEKMYKLGWKDETERYWINNDARSDIPKESWGDNWMLFHSEQDRGFIEYVKRGTKAILPAPDATEIMEELHKGLEDDCNKYIVNLFMTKFKEENKKWIIGNTFPLSKGIWHEYGKSQAECLGKMWCYLKEKGLI